MSEPRKQSLRAAFRSKDFRRVALALAASTAGDWIYGTALIVYIYEATGSPGWVAAAGIFRLAPYIFLSPVAGALADRFDKKRVMVATDVVRGLLMFALAASAALDAPVALAIAIAFLSTAAGTPFGPAQTGLMPALVEERDLAAANASMSTIEHTALIAGPAIGGALMILGSAAIAFALNGITFVVSAVLLIGVGARTTRSDKPTAEERLGQQIAAGIRTVTSSASVSVPVVLYALASLAYGFEIVALVVVAERVLGIGAEGVGFLNAGVGIGGVAAAGLSSRLAEDPRSSRALALGVIGCGLPLAVLAVTGNVVVACLLVAGIGAGNIILEVMTITVLQRILDERVLARVFGLLDAIGVLGILVGSLVAPVLIGRAGIGATLVIVGLGIPLLALPLAPTMRRLDRSAAERARQLAPVVDRLAALGIFDALSRQTLEQLAGRSEERSVAPGTLVVTEGEPARDFFVVLEGDLEVESSGEEKTATIVNRMTAGDYFGEIGLLEKIPRTASVRAIRECRLLAISGEDFLDAVNRPRTRSGTLVNDVVARLARTHPSYEPRLAEAKT